MTACRYRWEAALATLIPRYGLHASNKAKIHRKCHFWSLRIDLGARTRIEGHGYREESIPSGRGKYRVSPESSIRAQRLEFQKSLLFFSSCTNPYEICLQPQIRAPSEPSPPQHPPMGGRHGPLSLVLRSGGYSIFRADHFSINSVCLM